MSGAQNIDVVRGMFEAYLASAPERAREFLHPDVEYDATLRPDGKVWRGREGVRGALAEWNDTWEDYELEVEGYLDGGGGRVAVLWRERGRGKASGVPLSEAGAMVCTVRDGMIVAIVVSLDRDAALRRIGLRA